MKHTDVLEIVHLPTPVLDSPTSVEAALQARRSVRSFEAEPLSLADISQLLWAGQGITDPRGFRAAPSAGGLYPLEIYAVVGYVASLSPGIYKYHPQKHDIGKLVDGDKRIALSQASLGQYCVQEGPLSFVVAAIPDRLAATYGERAQRYAYLEAGHVAQNILLEAVSLHLGTVCIGAFREDDLRQALSLSQQEEPLYILTIGKLKTQK